MSFKHRTLVRELIKNSIGERGVVERELVEEVLASLREAKVPRHGEILRLYLVEIRKHIRSQSIEVEFGSESEHPLVSLLEEKFKAFSAQSFEFHSSTNEDLIAGYRIRIMDDVYEDSIQTRLSRLSQSFK